MPRPCRLAHRLRTTTALGLVPLLLAASVPACATRSSRPAVPADTQPASRNWWVSAPVGEWSRVEAVPVGTQIMVQLYGDAAPPDRRRVTGRLHAATADTLTLTLTRPTRTRTLSQSDVHIVHIRRPIRNRYAGWLTLVGGTLGLAAYLAGYDFVFRAGLLRGLTVSGPASLIGFVGQRRQRIYEVPPEASRLITQVDVPVTDGDVVPRSLEVTVSVIHTIQAGRPRNETIGLTVCLSSHPARCTGQWEAVEGPVRRLSSPQTATLQLGDETVPGDTPVSIYMLHARRARHRLALAPRAG